MKIPQENYLVFFKLKSAVISFTLTLHFDSNPVINTHHYVLLCTFKRSKNRKFKHIQNRIRTVGISGTYIAASYNIVHLYIQLTLKQFCTLSNMQNFAYGALTAYYGTDKVSS